MLDVEATRQRLTAREGKEITDMTTEMERVEIAQGLYGQDFDGLPELVQAAAADFAGDLLDMDTRRVLDMDGAAESSDCSVPTYYHEQFYLLADTDLWAWVMDTSEGNFETPQEGEDLYHYACRAATIQYAQALFGLFGVMVSAIEGGNCWGAFGLDDEAAEVAASLLPDWSGTLSELVAAAASLEVAR